MRILVTGAAGFLGRAVVRRLLESEHEVIAMVRPTTKTATFARSERLTFVSGDLRQKGAWRNELGSVDAVIHLAAAVEGDLSEQFAGTVMATENLLASLPKGLRRFVHVSTFSVYDYSALPSGTALDENSPLEACPEERDAYTWTKLLQEELVREHCANSQVPLAIVRPGAIYGPGKTWGFGSALSLGKLDLVFSPFAKFKITQVDNCAEAIVLAAESDAAEGQTFNIVDDDLPSHIRYRRMCRRAGAAVPAAVYVPWPLVAATGLLARFVNRSFLGGRARLPEFLAYRRQQARWKPLRYSNSRLKALLGWVPRVTLQEGVRGMIAERPTVANAPVEPALAHAPEAAAR